MTTVPLIALMPLKYGGVHYRRGSQFNATFAHARVLKAIKRAADAPAYAETKAGHYETAVLTPEPDTVRADRATATDSDVAKTTTTRVYRRKDLTAKP